MGELNMEKRLGYQRVGAGRKSSRTGELLPTETMKSIKGIKFLLPQSLVSFSIVMGILGTFSSALAPFLFANNGLFLCGWMFAAFTFAVVPGLLLKKKRHRLKPEDSVLLQGRLFRLWFTGHNLLWAFGFSLITVILLLLFGPAFEVMAVAAGALACIVFSAAGFLIGTGTRTLGLCWQSPVPRGVGNWWDYVGTTIILKERYEHAVRHDQNRDEPVLWGISRVLELAAGGGANRTQDLMASPATTMRKEWLHRFKVLIPVFIVTVLLVFILRELPGLTPPDLHRSPGGGGKGGSEMSEKSDNKQDREQGDPGEKPGNQGEEKKDSREGEDKGQEGKQSESKDGRDQGKESGEGQGQGEPSDKTDGEGKGEGKGEGEGKEKGKGKGEGESKESQGGEAQGDQGGQANQGKTGQDQKGAKGKQGAEGGKGESDRDKQDSDTSCDNAKGEGRGQSAGTAEHEPEMRTDPEVPLPPPGATEMLELDLPPLDRGETSKEPTDEELQKKEPKQAPASPAVSPQKKPVKRPPGSKTVKPEQYLPNWILSLLKESKNDK